jgi:hypothetical protein
VQSYLNNNTVSLYSEVQQILQRFPLPKNLVDQYLLKMQHKISIESRCLSRISSTSFELTQNLVVACIDWHCKPTISGQNSK